MSPIRLLQYNSDGEIVFREPTTSDVPAYAILSHTWGKEEVSFQDIEAGEGMSKAGWKKIQFCAKQAAADGLKYFWIDTCCINKRDAVELSAAINSMFRWYHEATRCYVYLSDVSIQGEGQNGQINPTWEAAFTKSRWFTRGWTLQELIAPVYIDFFSSEGERLGNKLSLEALIHSITGIARNALRNEPLSIFSIDHRMSWAERRNTTLEEDKAYCLLGIFDISMPLIYGEGREKAVRRLRHEIHMSYKGIEHDQFSVGIDLSTLPQSVQFVARSNELAEMYRILYNRSTRSIVVLHGLGGIGKTQLALTYAMRHEEKYTAILWINANDEDSLKLSFRAVAQQILKYHPSISVLNGVDLDDLDQVVYAVKAWLDLQKNAHWLIIYDNYDNPRIHGNTDSSAVDIRQFLPGSNHGSIIITTRSAQVSQGCRIHVQKFLGVQEALEILSNTSGRKDIVEEPAAMDLVKELDGLPLALSTAGAYLEHVTTSLSEYLQLYRASWLKLQQTSPQLSSYGEDRSLFLTWQITFDRIEQQNAKSAKLLKLWAYFDRQDVWFELLRHGSSSDEEWLQELTEDNLSFNEAIRLLRDYGLVDADLSSRQLSGSDGYSVHGCVHSWMVFVLNNEWDQKLARVALSCVASMIPDTNTDNWWLLQRRLLQHAIWQAHLIEGVKLDIKGLEWALTSFGHLYADQGKLADAEAMYTRALQGTEEALGSKHTSTLNTVNNLGALYVDQGKLIEAEAMYTRALQGTEEAFGPKHTSTLDTVNNLGILYADQGKLAEAEIMYTRALQGTEEALGLKHTSTLNTVNNLGILYKNQGKLAEAEIMYTRALQGYEEALGPKHTSTLITINNLGILYKNQGKLTEAETMYTRALQGTEEALGSKHTSTLNTVNNLGALYVDQGKLIEAEAMYTRALQGYEEALGPKHTSTLNTVNNLGLLYADQGKLIEAETMYTRALQGKEEAFGSKHTSILITVNNLGNLYADQGKLTEAETMYTRALQGYEEALGPEFVLSYLPALSTIFAFGDLFSRTGRKDLAKVMYSQALSGYTAIQGPSSKWCRQLEDRLQALQSEPTKSKAGQDESTEIGAPKSRSLKKKLYKLGRRSKVG